MSKNSHRHTLICARSFPPGLRPSRNSLKGSDPPEIPELGFKNHLALAEYMKAKGYLWNHQDRCYQFKGSEAVEDEPAKSSSNDLGNPELEEMVQVLLKNRDYLDLLYQLDGNKCLPRYSLGDIRIAKTIQVSNRLNQLIMNFTADKDINQREFFEIAAIEMMKKHGYEAEIKGLLG